MNLIVLKSDQKQKQKSLPFYLITDAVERAQIWVAYGDSLTGFRYST